jgi:DNA excision repair protein ERCC-4
MPAIRIVIDERERNSRVPNLLRAAGVLIDFAQLRVGDYIVSTETAVERKTIKDLISSIYDGRLFLQCSGLNQNYNKPVVVIEGNMLDLLNIHLEMQNDKQFRTDIERLPLAYDALAKIALNFRIPIIHTPSPEYTAQLLIVMVNRLLQDAFNSGPLLKRIRKANHTYIQQLSILSSLPGVGDKLANKMLQKFKTPHCALNASVADLAKIAGFGIARAAKVRKILDHPVNEKNVNITTQTKLWDTTK